MILTTIAYKLCLLLVAVQISPCFATVYGLNAAECDGNPQVGAFGPMHRYPRELAMTRSLQDKLGIEPGDKVLVLTKDGRFSGIYNLWDRMPGVGRKIDLQVEGSNWSGSALILTFKEDDE